MGQLTPHHLIKSNPDRAEISFSITGFWDFEAIEALHAELNQHAYPFFKAGRKIHVMGDMQGFVTQSRQTGDAIREHLARSANFNLSRIAIYNASTLVKLQYQRISTGIEVEFFDNRTDAIRWLRRPYADAA